jgi:hypothetical protein
VRARAARLARPSRGHHSGLGFRSCPPYILVMLRMRKKPPADLPNVNAGKPWSAIDLADLDELLTNGTPAAEIASYLCRDVDEVEAKIASRRN